MCAKFRFSISSRCDDMVAEVKGGNYMPPPAAGGWRGGPAAAGLTYLYQLTLCVMHLSDLTPLLLHIILINLTKTNTLTPQVAKYLLVPSPEPAEPTAGAATITAATATSASLAPYLPHVPTAPITAFRWSGQRRTRPTHRAFRPPASVTSPGCVTSRAL